MGMPNDASAFLISVCNGPLLPYYFFHARFSSSCNVPGDMFLIVYFGDMRVVLLIFGDNAPLLDGQFIAACSFDNLPVSGRMDVFPNGFKDYDGYRIIQVFTHVAIIFDQQVVTSWI